ncbi:dynamin family protein [Bacillus testis]|uniref:dynamin family protein n=1 Tax=Bacillus testis TaxID=1622072 RepID=UPI00067F2B84|nr:dynamin family protein [Bacillus testis]
MTNTTTNHTGVLNLLAALFNEMESRGDSHTAAKVKQLLLKADEKEVQLAFCGHFSAGKSSMINYLMGRQVLPSSPIPTSANIVKVKKGQDAFTVYFFDGTHTVFPGNHDVNEIKAYCKNGESIQSIHIHSGLFPLPEDCAVLDTPGIDSTDDAHRVSTESTLHLADIILYVMDYNHVQSQENFLFAKKMQESGKKLYLVVNQIDKHDAHELDFGHFKTSTADAFRQWGIRAEEIFYTSLRDLSHPNNQIGELKQFIHEKIEYERGHLDESVLRSAAQLAKEHLAFVYEQQEGERSQAEHLLRDFDEKRRETIPQELARYESQLHELQSLPEQKRLKSIEALNELLKNAYLLSADSRQLIKDYLESRQKNFKIGMFFTKGKTDTERTKREDALRDELEERIKTQLVWHLREFAGKALAQANVESTSLENAAQNISIEVDMDELKQLVANQGDITGQYVLRYSEQVGDIIKKKAKSQMLLFLEEVKQTSLQQLSEEVSELDGLVRHFRRLQEALLAVGKLDEEYRVIQEGLQFIIDNKRVASDQETAGLMEAFKAEEEAMCISMPLPEEDDQPIDREATANQPMAIEAEMAGSRGESLTHWSMKLKQAAEDLENTAGFATLVEEMKEKAERMDNQYYTIALFGAFSAGKSSFANALLGEKILPVSPNPTTAVINKIMHSSDEAEHRTARIEMKSREMLLADVKLACNALDYSPADLEDAFVFSASLEMDSFKGDGREKAHLSFLKAFSTGYEAYKQKLGSTFIVDYEEYTAFAAEESKSCFVNEIVLYYDCPMTQKGIVLVDTPGADSINARHTNAAFHYIKNSDAILFVTYYNHPFAKSDREFLIQLGRVKDSFAMDKMFFLCNAIDLAQTQEELDDVTGYIRQQLESFGIRFPRLFPISSKEALRELHSEDAAMEHAFLEDSGMPRFQQAFNHFIQHELIELACSSARSAIKRAADMLHELIVTATSSEEEKAKRLQEVKEEYTDLASSIEQMPTEVEESKLAKESDELQYYIFQRVFLRYNDFFKESFNPAVLQDDGRDLKQALRKALRELIDSVGFDLEQEMRATSLRLERFIAKLIAEKQQQYQHLLNKTWKAVQLGEFRIQSYEVPDYGKAFASLSSADFKKELALFRNPKSFFEKNEKQKMAELLQQALRHPAQEYLEEQGLVAKGVYNHHLLSELDALKKQTLHLIEEVWESYQAALGSQTNTEELLTKEKTLVQLLS